jgi:hypothetical protein
MPILVSRFGMKEGRKEFTIISTDYGICLHNGVAHIQQMPKKDDFTCRKMHQNRQQNLRVFPVTGSFFNSYMVISLMFWLPLHSVTIHVY